MVERKITSNSIVYKCDRCGKILGELTDVEEVIIYGDCEHYKWFEVSWLCYEYEPPGCGRSYIRWLKENYVLKLESPGTVYLLIPRQS